MGKDRTYIDPGFGKGILFSVSDSKVNKITKTIDNDIAALIVTKHRKKHSQQLIVLYVF